MQVCVCVCVCVRACVCIAKYLLHESINCTRCRSALHGTRSIYYTRCRSALHRVCVCVCVCVRAVWQHELGVYKILLRLVELGLASHGLRVASRVLGFASSHGSCVHKI